MELFALQCFMALIEEEKFSSAAEKMHLSQSSFSKTISALEEEVGTRLFNRTPQGTLLNDAGKLLLPFVDRILSSYNDAETHLNQFYVEEEKTIHLYTHAYLTSYGIQHFLSIYKADNPDVDVVFHECDTMLALTQISTAENHIGIVFTYPELITEYAENRSVHFIPLMSDDIVAVMHKNHALANCNVISIKQLKNQSLHIISERQDPALHRFLSTELHTKGLRYENSNFNLWATTVNLFIQNKNMVYLTARCIADFILEEADNLVLCPIRGINPIQVSVVGNTASSCSSPLEHFYTFALNYSSTEM